MLRSLLLLLRFRLGSLGRSRSFLGLQLRHLGADSPAALKRLQLSSRGLLVIRPLDIDDFLLSLGCLCSLLLRFGELGVRLFDRLLSSRLLTGGEASLSPPKEAAPRSVGSWPRRAPSERRAART